MNEGNFVSVLKRFDLSSAKNKKNKNTINLLFKNLSVFLMTNSFIKKCYKISRANDLLSL